MPARPLAGAALWLASAAEVLVQGSVRLHRQGYDGGGADLGLVAAGTGYAPVKYAVGETVECRAKDSTWVPCMIVDNGPDFCLYIVHIADDFPGHRLEDVPCQLIRRRLNLGDGDFLVDNSVLQHKGKGVKYRFSKNADDMGGEYAPWGSVIVGRDEGDGWVRTDRGQFLPTQLHEVRVLQRRDRSQRPPALQLAAVGASSKLAEHAQEATYELGEHVEFRSTRGDWFPAIIHNLGVTPGFYNVIVTPVPGATHPVADVPWDRLRKTPVLPSKPVEEGGGAACTGGDCLLLRVKNRFGKVSLFQVSRMDNLGVLMKNVCNRMNLEWETCQAQARFMHNNQQVRPTTSIASAGLEDMDLIDMQDAVATSPA